MKVQYNWSLVLFALIPLCISNARASDNRVEFIGEYSHIESATGEHCTGYSVTLWKYKDSLAGFLYHHRGLCGDPPMGILEGTTYSVSTGSLSFNVKLSDGSIFQAGREVPTKDKVTFKGKLHGQMLEGVVSWYWEGNTQSIRSENVTLKAENPKNSPHRSFDNYDEWMKYWGPILKLRGPRW